MVIESGIFGGSCWNSPNPYLYSTIVLFDYDLTVTNSFIRVYY